MPCRKIASLYSPFHTCYLLGLRLSSSTGLACAFIDTIELDTCFELPLRCRANACTQCDHALSFVHSGVGAAFSLLGVLPIILVTATSIAHSCNCCGRISSAAVAPASQLARCAARSNARTAPSSDRTDLPVHARAHTSTSADSGDEIYRDAGLLVEPVQIASKPLVLFELALKRFEIPEPTKV